MKHKLNERSLKEMMDSVPKHTKLFNRFIIQLSESINQATRERGIRNKDLAKQAHMKESQLSRYINGTANPNLRTIARLSAALDCELISFPKFEALQTQMDVSTTLFATTQGVIADIPIKVAAKSGETESITWSNKAAVPLRDPDQSHA